MGFWRNRGVIEVMVCYTFRGEGLTKIGMCDIVKG